MGLKSRTPKVLKKEQLSGLSIGELVNGKWVRLSSNRSLRMNQMSIVHCTVYGSFILYALFKLFKVAEFFLPSIQTTVKIHF